MAYTVTDDDEFAAFAKRAEEEAAAQNNRGGNYQQRDYDKIEWVGLEDKAKIIRIVGGAPSSMKPGAHINPTDAHEIFVSTILDDNGKRMKLKLPLHADDAAHEHIMWRIINKVNEVKWVKGADGKSTKVNVNEQYPWFEKVNKGGFAPTDKSLAVDDLMQPLQDSFASWRINYEFCKRTGGLRFPCRFLSRLRMLLVVFLQDGGYGQKTNPVEVKQATLYKKNGLVQELDKDKLQYVSLNETLTPEELEYERYDISKFFAPTTYQKILSKLGNTIKAIDVDLRTNYYEELQALAEKEKKEFEEIYGTNAPAQEAAPAQTATVAQPVQTAPATEAAPVRTAVREAAPARATGLTSDKIALLKGWDLMTDEEKAVIVDVVKNPDGTLKDIVYNTDHPVLACPADFPDGSHGCGINAPDFFHVCPSCGKAF